MNLGRNRRIVFILASGGLLTLVAILLALPPIRAAGPWYVAPGGDDSNDCLSPGAPCATINGTIAKASGGDTIYVTTGTYTGTGEWVVRVDKDATLSGGWDETFTTQSGTSTIDGEDVRMGMTVNTGVHVTVERFTVQNGSGDPYGYSGAGINSDGTLTLNSCIVSDNFTGGRGGGIYNSGVLTLNGSTVSSNTGQNEGGGIYNLGTLVLNNCTVSGNSSYNGGGIRNASGNVVANRTYIGKNSGTDGGGIGNSGTVTLINSTIGDNTTYTSGYCYPCHRGGGINNSGTVELYSSTVVGNQATGEMCNPSCEGGGIYNIDGEVVMQNTIVAANTADTLGPDCVGTATSAGYSLIGDTSDCTFASTTGDLINVDASLFPVTVSQGYRPLMPGSLAIDAGNPAGCTDDLGNPLTSDQRGTPRPLDGDGDGDALCDIGSYELDPEHPIRRTYLPLCAHNYYVCPDFFDGFSNPASGWAVMDDSYVRTEYLNGEYRVLTKQSGYFYLFRAPTCDRQDYMVSVDARWVGTPGSSYGLIFGLARDYSRYYLFDMNTDYKQFRLLRRDPTGFVTIVPITGAPAINGGTASNHLKVTRNGTGITLEVNGAVLGTWYDATIGGRTGAGLVTNPYYDLPTSDARFDNFAVISLPGDGASVAESGNVTPDGIEFIAPNARRDLAPVDMAW